MKLILAAILFLAPLSSFAGPADEYKNGLLAQVLLRQVASENLLKGSSRSFKADLVKALEGAGTSKATNSINGMNCERALGTDECSISVSGITSDTVEPEYSFKVNVRVFQGKVVSADISDFAG